MSEEQFNLGTYETQEGRLALRVISGIATAQEFKTWDSLFYFLGFVSPETYNRSLHDTYPAKERTPFSDVCVREGLSEDISVLSENQTDSAHTDPAFGRYITLLDRTIGKANHTPVWREFTEQFMTRPENKRRYGRVYGKLANIYFNQGKTNDSQTRFN